MTFPLIHRRHALQLLASAGGLALVAAITPAMAQPQDGVARIIVLSDLHSAYERTGQLLAALEAEIAGHPENAHLIAINGDVFELGNVVASRSAGAIDWEFLARVAKLAPTVLNIGNHEPDLINDLAEFIVRAQAIGITVVSNIVDVRTGRPYAPASSVFTLGAQTISVVGIATNAVNTYPKPTREQLDIAEPVKWATDNLNKHLPAGNFALVLSHAGVVADQSILPLLADGTLLVGGHDHLLFTHDAGKTRYVHTGSWTSVYSVATIAEDGTIEIEQVNVALDATPSPALAELIAATLAEHLTAEEKAAIGHNDTAQTLSQTGRQVAATMASAANADIGFVGHTTLGTGLPAGNVSKYQFDAVVRFDGKLMLAEVDAAGLKALLARANQDGDIALSARNGDFVYGAPEALETKDSYTIVANDWSATNQKSYFGREDLVFTEVPDVKLKALITQSLAK